MAKRVITYAAAGSLVLLCLGAVTYAFFASIKLNSALSDLLQVNNQFQAAQAENSGLKTEWAALAEELSELTSKVESQDASLAELQSELDEAESELASAIERADELEKAGKELETSFGESRKQNSAMNRKIDFYECDDDLEMDYSSVMAASSRLMSYVDGLPSVDHISTAYRNTLWGNADSKIYGVNYVADDREMYSMQFLVYFNEFGMKKGVFYVDGQCWLDSPVK